MNQYTRYIRDKSPSFKNRFQGKSQNAPSFRPAPKPHTTQRTANSHRSKYTYQHPRSQRGKYSNLSVNAFKKQVIPVRSKQMQLTPSRAHLKKTVQNQNPKRNSNVRPYLSKNRSEVVFERFSNQGKFVPASGILNKQERRTYYASPPQKSRLADRSQEKTRGQLYNKPKKSSNFFSYCGSKIVPVRAYSPIQHVGSYNRRKVQYLKDVKRKFQIPKMSRKKSANRQRSKKVKDAMRNTRVQGTSSGKFQPKGLRKSKKSENKKVIYISENELLKIRKQAKPNSKISRPKNSLFEGNSKPMMFETLQPVNTRVYQKVQKSPKNFQSSRSQKFLGPSSRRERSLTPLSKVSKQLFHPYFPGHPYNSKHFGADIYNNNMMRESLPTHMAKGSHSQPHVQVGRSPRANREKLKKIDLKKSEVLNVLGSGVLPEKHVNKSRVVQKEGVTSISASNVFTKRHEPGSITVQSKSKKGPQSARKHFTITALDSRECLTRSEVMLARPALVPKRYTNTKGMPVIASPNFKNITTQDKYDKTRILELKSDEKKDSSPTPQFGGKPYKAIRKDPPHQSKTGMAPSPRIPSKTTKPKQTRALTPSRSHRIFSPSNHNNPGLSKALKRQITGNKSLVDLKKMYTGKLETHIMVVRDKHGRKFERKVIRVSKINEPQAETHQEYNLPIQGKFMKMCSESESRISNSVLSGFVDGKPQGEGDKTEKKRIEANKGSFFKIKNEHHRIKSLSHNARIVSAQGEEKMKVNLYQTEYGMIKGQIGDEIKREGQTKPGTHSTMVKSPPSYLVKVKKNIENSQTETKKKPRKNMVENIIKRGGKPVQAIEDKDLKKNIKIKLYSKNKTTGSSRKQSQKLKTGELKDIKADKNIQHKIAQKKSFKTNEPSKEQKLQIANTKSHKNLNRNSMETKKIYSTRTVSTKKKESIKGFIKVEKAKRYASKSQQIIIRTRKDSSKNGVSNLKNPENLKENRKDEIDSQTAKHVEHEAKMEKNDPQTKIQETSEGSEETTRQRSQKQTKKDSDCFRDVEIDQSSIRMSTEEDPVEEFRDMREHFNYDVDEEQTQLHLKKQMTPTQTEVKKTEDIYNIYSSSDQTPSPIKSKEFQIQKLKPKIQEKAPIKIEISTRKNKTDTPVEVSKPTKREKTKKTNSTQTNTEAGTRTPNEAQPRRIRRKKTMRSNNQQIENLRSELDRKSALLAKEKSKKLKLYKKSKEPVFDQDESFFVTRKGTNEISKLDITGVSLIENDQMDQTLNDSFMVDFLKINKKFT